MANTKKIVFSVLRIAVSAAIFVYIFTALVDPKVVLESFKKADFSALWKLILLGFLPLFLSVVRWYVLMRAIELKVTLWQTMRLGYIGIFFNNFMLGSTGGDVIKAVIVARITDRKVPAVVSIFFDRVVGLVALSLVGLFAVLYFWGDPGLFIPRIIILSLLGGCCLFVLVYFNKTIRESSLMKAVFSRLPLRHLFKEIDETMVLYRSKKWYVLGALGLGICVHITAVLLVMGICRAVGEGKMEVYHYFAYVPLGLMANALPISFGGLGVQEFAYMKLFAIAGVDEVISGTAGFVVRMVSILWTLPGGLFFIFGTSDIKISAEEKKELENL